jgi:hypothetical protein
MPSVIPNSFKHQMKSVKASGAKIEEQHYNDVLAHRI